MMFTYARKNLNSASAGSSSSVCAGKLRTRTFLPLLFLCSTGTIHHVETCTTLHWERGRLPSIYKELHWKVHWNSKRLVDCIIVVVENSGYRDWKWSMSWPRQFWLPFSQRTKGTFFYLREISVKFHVLTVARKTSAWHHSEKCQWKSTRRHRLLWTGSWEDLCNLTTTLAMA